MAEKKLTKDAQLYTVQRLACFAGPSEVAAELKEHFGVAVSLPTILHYDPTKAQGRDLSGELTAIFHEIRAKYRADVSTIPIANAAWRLEKLQRVVEFADKRGALAVTMAALKQAKDETTGTGAQATGAAPGSTENTGANPPDFAEHVRKLKEQPNAAQSLVDLYTDLLPG